MPAIKKNIVILGGGFGGVKCALDLAKTPLGGAEQYQIIIIDKNNYHTYYPMLYEVATANLERLKKFDFEKLEETVAIPFKEIFLKSRVKFQKAVIKEVDLKNNLVRLNNNNLLTFEYLVFALGSETNYFNIPRASEKSFGFKSVEEAMNIRNALNEIFYNKKQKEKIKIVIVGGGFSGCELAGELSYFIKKLSKIRNFPLDQVEISVIEANKQVLPGAKEEVIKLVQERLKSLKINLVLEQTIKDVSEIEFDILIWTAGIQANFLIKSISNLPLTNKSCLIVNEYLQISHFKNIFGAGDNILCPIIATAQSAIDHGKIVAKNILRDINKESLIAYQPRQPFFVIPLGSKYAVADLKIIILKGWLAWLLKYLVSLKYFLSILPIKKALTLWFLGFKLFMKND